MHQALTLISDQYPEVALHSIKLSDQENLRNWKNANRQSFFYQQIISSDDQQKWFEAYLKRDDDFMFIVMAAEPIGCMGFRFSDQVWDVYNVILGRPEFGRKGHMSHALQMMCSFARQLALIPITAKVLKDNPAVSWYKRNAFRVVAIQFDHVEIEIDLSVFTACAVTKY